MKIVSDKCGSMRKGIERTWNFERWAHLAGDYTLFSGIVSEPEILNALAETERIVHINTEEPNGFFSRFLTSYLYEDSLSKVFTYCPFTAKWYNKQQGNDKRTAIFIPFNEDIIPPATEKVVDILYVGASVSDELCDMLDHIKTRNHRILCINDSQHATHVGVSYNEKLKHISESKVTLIHNVLWPRMRHRDQAALYFPGVLENKAFVEIKEGREPWHNLGEPTAPQLKGRTFETAFCRSLMLVRRDPWKLIENWFEPGKEFVYFEPGHFEEKLQEVLENYESYQPVIDAAYDRAINNYTTKHFFDKYLREL